MKYEMPAVSDNQRAELVNLLINRHAIMEPDVDTKRMEQNMEIVLDIALAALNAEPVGYLRMSDFEFNGHNEFSGGGIGNEVYTAPPVPALKQIKLSADFRGVMTKQSVIADIRAAGYEVKDD